MACLERMNQTRGEKRSKLTYNYKNFKRDGKKQINIWGCSSVIYQRHIFIVPKYDHIPRFFLPKHHQDCSQALAKTFPS